MGIIRVLQPSIANQIAAGEVVERPASIVKELIENSIDAGATAITVEIRGGGIQYIRIADNGSGIARDDLKVAFLRHSTSKISSVDDLSHIETLGFRGEALCSIAAVSHINMKTKTADSEIGSILAVNGGELGVCTDCACADGTLIEVSDVFYNIPARLKFLKSPRTEAGYIGEYLSKLIMARPDIAFKFINEDKTIYQSYGDGELRNAIYCIYGTEVVENIRETSFDDGYIKVSGYIGSEDISRVNRQHQSLFVNGRYIKANKLSFAIQRAFDTRLMSGRFPFFVLNIAISSREIDVNVHPNKLDIRFKNEDRVFSALTAAARRSIGDFVIPSVSMSAYGGCDEAVQTAPVAKVVSLPNSIKTDGEVGVMSQASGASAFVPVDLRSGQAKPQSFKLAEPGSYVFQYMQQNPLREPQTTDVRDYQVDGNSSKESDTKPFSGKQETFDASPYSVVGQVFNTYWIVQQGDRMLLVDQHAAHERKLYEAYRAAGVDVKSQHLLTPELVTLSPQEFDVFVENKPHFESLGFEMDEFGPLTIRVTAMPHILGKPEALAFLHDALALLSRSAGGANADEIKRNVIIQASCKHAVKGGEYLDIKEIEALLSDYAKGEIPLTCPHGRPVMLSMGKRELEKMFKRIV